MSKGYNIMIGILAVQGAFAEHAAMLDRMGISHFEIRQKSDLDHQMDGLILPGGESTVMGKLLWELDLFEPLKEKINNGLPVFGTCAGLILLAKTIVNDSAVYFGSMNITARRNAYGRQLGSFHTGQSFRGIGDVPMTFIRAPYIDAAGNGVEVLAKADGHIVAARQGNQMVTAFHPELTEDESVHRYFIDIIQAG